MAYDNDVKAKITEARNRIAETRKEFYAGPGMITHSILGNIKSRVSIIQQKVQTLSGPGREFNAKRRAGNTLYYDNGLTGEKAGSYLWKRKLKGRTSNETGS